MTRRRGIGALALAAAAALTATVVPALPAGTVPAAGAVERSLVVLAAGFAAYAAYALVAAVVLAHTASKRRRHDVRGVLRLAFLALGVVAVLAAATEQWVGALVSLGVAGVAVSLALQQPLLSLFGWVYIMAKQPYRVGDRVAIADSKGDVIAVDFLVTTLWEINGELVSSNQPSGRVVTVPNSAVLAAHVTNFTDESFPCVWNEIAVQVAYETDLDYAVSEMTAVADDRIGDEMARRVTRYRELLAETPVELDVRERPSVNVVQTESWVELRLRYLADPRQSQRVKNDLYREILARFNDAPEQVKFPVGRNR